MKIIKETPSEGGWELSTFSVVADTDDPMRWFSERNMRKHESEHDCFWMGLEKHSPDRYRAQEQR